MTTTNDDDSSPRLDPAAVDAAVKRLTFPPTQDGQAIVWDADLKLALAALSATPLAAMKALDAALAEQQQQKSWHDWMP